MTSASKEIVQMPSLFGASIRLLPSGGGMKCTHLVKPYLTKEAQQ